MNQTQYNRLVPYKSICEIFAKHGEYIGGADNLITIYEQEFSTKVAGNCPACMGAMLLDVDNKIKEYERNLPGV